ncbi:MAG: IS982 family transposase [Chloroflexi bacterium]|nr:IS982 family transposase [Chloroflexota bacterium]
MDLQIILVYCLCADLLSALHHQEDDQCQLSDAEVMTAAILAALYFGGKHHLACTFLDEQGYMPHMLSKSQFSRRLHRLDALFLALFRILGESFKALNAESIYIIDSAPIAACDNIRIRRNKLYGNEAYHGYQASKHRYFYGVKIHLLVTKDHQPRPRGTRFFLSPGSVSGPAALTHYAFDLPAGAFVFADKAYTDYLVEDLLAEVGICLAPERKKNAKRRLLPWVCGLLHYYRNQVETAGSLIEPLLPKSTHAVTAKGFELKVILFVLASSINCLATPA